MCSDHISLPFTSDNKMERCVYLLSPFLAPCSLPGIPHAFPTSGFHDRFMRLFKLSTHLKPSLCSYSSPPRSQCSQELPVPWAAITSWANGMLISFLGWDVHSEVSGSVTIYCFWALPFFLTETEGCSSAPMQTATRTAAVLLTAFHTTVLFTFPRAQL